MSPKKVEPQDYTYRPMAAKLYAQEESTFARIAGIFFVLIAITIIGLLVLSFIISKLPYRSDATLPIPTLDEVAQFTNKDSVDLRGSNIPGEIVALYVNDEIMGEQSETDKDGNFLFQNVELLDEGEYSIEAVTVRGKFNKKRSELSNEIKITVDRTDPSGDVAAEYETVSTSGTAQIRGQAEADGTVVLKSGTREFEATTDAQGLYSFDGVSLLPGENNFEVSVRDRAGNETLSSTLIQIVYEGSINGDGATADRPATQLPESAGELEQIMEFLAGNELMFAFGLAAVILMAISTTGAIAYSRKRS